VEADALIANDISLFWGTFIIGDDGEEWEIEMSITRSLFFCLTLEPLLAVNVCKIYCAIKEIR